MWQYKYSDELYHWKYIHKEKVNGKWRYYYEIDKHKEDIRDALGFDERAAVKDMGAGLADAKARKEVIEKNLEKSYKEPKNLSTPEHRNLIVNDSKAYVNAVNAYEARKVNYDKLVSRYAKTPLGRLENAAKKGKELLRKLFNF